ncbi:MAG: hypothetical protein ACQEW8_03355 [Actinomycetota bacterium]
MTDPQRTVGATPPGGHVLPVSFSGGSALTRRPHRVRRVLLPSLAVLALVATGGIVHLEANRGYDAALEQFDDALYTAVSEMNELDEDMVDLTTVSASAAEILESDSGRLVSDDANQTLASSVDDAAEALEQAQLLLTQTLPSAEEKPLWTWELFGETTALTEDTSEIDSRVLAYEDSASELSALAGGMEDAGVDVLVASADAAAAVEADHVSAKNERILTLRAAAEDVAAASDTLDDSSSSAFSALDSAAADVVASHESALAEKAGPLLRTRLAIEDYARSLAPDVLMDFEWARIVNGAGENGSMGGYATWWYDRGGYSTIRFSDSVAEQWPSAHSKALIAHEVGHAISVKCQGMYDTSTQESIEAWATAWAISMGHTDDANGVWAYGTPPQSLIEKAADCR